MERLASFLVQLAIFLVLWLSGSLFIWWVGGNNFGLTFSDASSIFLIVYIIVTFTEIANRAQRGRD